MKIAIDAMGGDHAPHAQVEAAIRAVKEFADLQITLIGDETKMKPLLTDSHNRISMVHTVESILDTDKPTTAVRRKKDASMVLAVNEVKAQHADACISSGNTGALMTAGLLYVGRQKGIDRPALSPMLPTKDGNGFLLLDVGANMEAKAEHLLQYAVIGDAYMQKIHQVEKPRIGLLNVGTEAGKGTELTKEAYRLLDESTLHFVGNVEARDLLDGVCDVVVCDGFSGNLVLKTIEGTAKMLFSMLKTELTSSISAKLAAGMLKPKLTGLKKKMDYSEYGGAGLFGLKAPVIKAHGSSDSNAFFHAIRQAKEMVDQDVVAVIEANLLLNRRQENE
ncbi:MULTISPECIES: phosphate acyltransferase PlsX [Bacillaceae]|uniref:Phosphate acyltransferase n=2 Tax=Bacillaceae TaxID=186817 RepID=A0A9D5DQH0_9BACI|nr:MULTISPECIES: phosphate acyltransferase PlsX [Bacillaceae]KQL58203.1 phosphate acyltransferase [Alkalicoccobacillus plakortidis]MBG9784279.1 phosphate acyltransferase [Shouchella lehensis]TES50732.1 phosphate acyltransferase PlsX [Shouchella lehensis]